MWRALEYFDTDLYNIRMGENIMRSKKTTKPYTRKLGRIGSEQNHSFYITLPIKYIRALKWGEGQKVIVKKVGQKLHIIGK